VRIVPVTRRPRDNETTAVATLRGIFAAHGEEHFTLTVRTITETEGNARALVAPVLLAVSDVLLAYPKCASTTGLAGCT
jgi:hypothetical protein